MTELEKTACIIRATKIKLSNLKKTIKYHDYWRKCYRKECNADIGNSLTFARGRDFELRDRYMDFCNEYKDYKFPEIEQLRKLCDYSRTTK